MTRDEFRALQKGDRIRNPMTGSKGTVDGAETFRSGHIVTVRWDGAGMVFGSFGENSTAWMHWAEVHPWT